jgi:hypothetical protein
MHIKLYEYPDLTPALLLEGGWQIQTSGVFTRVFGNFLVVLPVAPDENGRIGVWVWATRGRAVLHTAYYDCTRSRKFLNAYDILCALNSLPQVPNKTWELNGVNMDDGTAAWWLNVEGEGSFNIEYCNTPEALLFQHFLYTRNIPTFIFPEG